MALPPDRSSGPPWWRLQRGRITWTYFAMSWLDCYLLVGGDCLNGNNEYRMPKVMQRKDPSDMSS